MRVSLVPAFLVIACGVACTQNAWAADDANVTVDLDVLPIPTPRFKPAANELRPLAQIHPRFKPAPEEIATDFALPRWKPGTEVAAIAAPAEPEPARAPAPAAAPPAPAVPVSIVSGPTTTPYAFPVEIRGVAHDPNANQKPINPLEGFAVLSRVRFSDGQSEIPSKARQALDTVAERLLASRERVRLAAFSGKAGDASSEARRLSLARALAIRTYLVSKGIAIDRVDVLAFGGAKDTITDRVHVLVRGI